MFTPRLLLRAIPRAIPRTLATKSTATATATATKTSTRHLSFKSTPRMRAAVPSEEHSAHTATQRLRSWARSLPVETYPLFVIMGSSLSFGIYSFVLPAVNDPTLRLRRSSGRGH